MSNKIKYIATANIGDSWGSPVTKYEIADSDLIVSTIPINSSSTDYGARDYHAVLWRVGEIEPYDVYAGVIGVVIPPEITSPPDEGEDVATDVTISWDKHGEGGTSTLQVATDPGFNTVVVNESGIVGEELQVNLGYNTEYFARVKTVINGEESEWSETVSFMTTAEGLQPPTLIAPADLANNVWMNTYFAWTEIQDAEHYNIQVADNPGFVNPVVDTSVFENDHQALLSQNTTYYWRVRSVGSEDTSDWSEAWSFKTTAISEQTTIDLFIKQTSI